MFINEDYQDFKYLVEASDNYVVLTNQRSVSGEWQNPDTIDVIYQYINPSILTIEGQKTFSSTEEFTQIDISHDFFDRGDCTQIITCELAVIFFIVFILNALTRFVRKGGVFFGS